VAGCLFCASRDHGPLLARIDLRLVAVCPSAKCRGSCAVRAPHSRMTKGTMPGAGVHDAGHGQAGVTTPRLPVAHASSESRRTRQGRRSTARTVDTTLIRKLAAAIENAADFYASDSFLATLAIEMRNGAGHPPRSGRSYPLHGPRCWHTGGKPAGPAEPDHPSSIRNPTCAEFPPTSILLCRGHLCRLDCLQESLKALQVEATGSRRRCHRRDTSFASPRRHSAASCRLL
jgi:hypothetical protein